MENLSNINIFDLILGSIVIISMLIGIARGLIREVLSVVAWTLAAWVAVTYAPIISKQHIKQFIEDDAIAYIAAAGGLFLLVLFVIGLINLLISSLLDLLKMGFLNRFLGSLFGLMRGALIGAVFVFFAKLFPNIETIDAWQKSKLVPGFMNLANWGINHIPEQVRARADTWLNPNRVLIIKQGENQNSYPTIELSSRGEEQAKPNPRSYQRQDPEQPIPRNNEVGGVKFRLESTR